MTRTTPKTCAISTTTSFGYTVTRFPARDESKQHSVLQKGVSISPKRSIYANGIMSKSVKRSGYHVIDAHYHNQSKTRMS